MSVTSWVAALAVLAAAVGTVQALPPNATHAYSFVAGYADELGGPPATPLLGNLDGAGGYVFPRGGGLRLKAGVVPRATYSIQMRFTPTEVSGYRRLVDVKNRKSDTGFYIRAGAAVFYPLSFGTNGTALSQNVSADVVITRKSSTKEVKMYVDGVEQIAFADSSDQALIDSKAPVYLFQDDLMAFGEETGGVLDFVRVWRVPLKAGDVSALAKGILPANVLQS